MPASSRLAAVVLVVLACGGSPRVEPIVPDREAPPPPGPSGAGWHCVAYRQRANDTTDSACARTLEACRTEASSRTAADGYEDVTLSRVDQTGHRTDVDARS